MVTLFGHGEMSTPGAARICGEQTAGDIFLFVLTSGAGEHEGRWIGLAEGMIVVAPHLSRCCS
jgi:hypothetical protein